MAEGRALTAYPRVWIAAWAAWLALGAGGAYAQSQADKLAIAAEVGQARNVMVRIYDSAPAEHPKAKKPGSCTKENIDAEASPDRNGSAVVLYADDRQVLLLTAEHNVPYGRGCATYAPAGEIDRDFAGDVLVRDNVEDWALVLIKGAGRAFGLHRKIQVRLRAEVDLLDEALLIVGNPAGKPNVPLETSIERPSGRTRLVLTDPVDDGYSGAGVYALNGDLVAIVTDTASNGYVLPVEHVCPVIEKHDKSFRLPLVRRPPPPRRSVQLNAYLALARRDRIDMPAPAHNGTTVGAALHVPLTDLTISRLALWARLAWDSIEVPERVLPPEPESYVLQESTARAHHIAFAFGIDWIFFPDFDVQPIAALAPVLGTQWFDPAVGKVEHAMTFGGTGSVGLRYQPAIARWFVIGLGGELSIMNMTAADYRFSGFGVGSEPAERDWFATSRFFVELGYLFR